MTLKMQKLPILTRYVLTFLIPTLLHSLPSQAESARLLPFGGKSVISGLSWQSSLGEVFSKNAKQYFKIQGAFNNKMQSLSKTDGEVLVKANPSEEIEDPKIFELIVPLEGKITYIELISVSSQGTLSNQRFTVDYPNWEEKK